MSFDLGRLQYELSLDDVNFKATIQKYDKQLDAFADKATKTGKELTSKLTLPIIGLGTVALKLAADFEVSSKKFTKAFDGASDKANKAVENLNNNYGIAITQSTALLANTGDLLKGFGATSDEAINLSESAQELAASLSAYNGVPITQSSEAIKSALVGEREALKQLGIVVSEEAVKKQLLADGTSELVGQELLLAKAQATLTIAYSQSGDAIDSFAENTDTAAFQTAALIADLKDLSVQFGTILLPVLKDVIGEVSEVIEWFADLDEQQKENVIRLLAITAAIPPLIIGVGNLSKAMKALATTGGLGVALIAITAIVAGIDKINKYDKKKQEDTFGALAESTGVAAQNLRTIADKSTTLIKNADSFAEGFNQASSFSGLTKNSFAELLILSGNLTEQQEAQVISLSETALTTQELIDLSNKRLKSEKAITVEKETQSKVGVEAYIKQNEAVQAVIDSNKTEIEQIDEQIANITKLSLADSTFKDDQLEAVEILQARKAEIINQEIEEIKEGLEEEKRIKEEAAEHEKALEKEISDEKKRLRLEDKQALIETGSFIVNQLTSIQNQRVTNAQAELDTFNATNGAIINALEAKAETEKGLTKGEQKRLDALNEKKKDLMQEQYEREIEAFNTEKALSIARTTMLGIEAAVKAYNAAAFLGPFVAAAAASTVGVFTAAQIATIAEQEPPPKPVFLAEGGIVNPTVSGTPAIIGEAGSPEAVIPLNDSFFNRIANAATGASMGTTSSQSGGNKTTIYNILDGKIIAENTVNLINNKVYTIDNRSIRA